MVKFAYGTFPASEIFPNSVKEGWGDVQIEIKGSITYSIGDVQNCGIQLITRVREEIGNPKTNLTLNKVPLEVRQQYFQTGWGGETFTSQTNLYVGDFIKKLNTKELRAKVCLQVADDIRKINHNCFMFTDSCNRHTRYRAGGGIASAPLVDTAIFCEYLIRNKIGYIVQSPVNLNPAHSGVNDISLARVWLWYPPGAIAFKTGRFLGTGKILTEKEAAEKADAENKISGKPGLSHIAAAFHSYADLTQL